MTITCDIMRLCAISFFYLLTEWSRVGENKIKNIVCPRYRALNKRVSGTVTKRAASVRVAVWIRKRSLHVQQQGAARKEKEKEKSPVSMFVTSRTVLK